MSRAADRLKVVLNHLDRSHGAVVSFQRRVYRERPARWITTLTTRRLSRKLKLKALASDRGLFSDHTQRTSRGIANRPGLLSTFQWWKYSFFNNIGSYWTRITLLLLQIQHGVCLFYVVLYSRYVLCAADIVYIMLWTLTCIIQRASFTSAQNVSYHHPQVLQLVSFQLQFQCSTNLNAFIVFCFSGYNHGHERCSTIDLSCLFMKRVT